MTFWGIGFLDRVLGNFFDLRIFFRLDKLVRKIINANAIKVRNNYFLYSILIVTSKRQFLIWIIYIYICTERYVISVKRRDTERQLSLGVGIGWGIGKLWTLSSRGDRMGVSLTWGRNRRARVLSGAGNKDIKSMDSRLMFPRNKKEKCHWRSLKWNLKKEGEVFIDQFRPRALAR